MKMVNKSCLVQQMIEKITLEVDAKICFGKSLDLLVIESSLSNRMQYVSINRDF